MYGNHAILLFAIKLCGTYLDNKSLLQYCSLQFSHDRIQIHFLTHLLFLPSHRKPLSLISDLRSYVCPETLFTLSQFTPNTSPFSAPAFNLNVTYWVRFVLAVFSLLSGVAYTNSRLPFPLSTASRMVSL